MWELLVRSCHGSVQLTQLLSDNVKKPYPREVSALRFI
jgi:hypothetical protein